MTRAVNLDFTINVPSNFDFAQIGDLARERAQLNSLSLGYLFDANAPIPAQLPPQLYADKHGLKEGDWTIALKRFLIPGFASAQDKKVSEYFINQLKNSLNDESLNNKQKVKSMLSLAEQYIARRQGWFPWETVSPDISRLEHYALSAHERLEESEPTQIEERLKRKYRSDNQDLLSRWTQAGFSEDAFWGNPDLVDFIFRTHLHRHINHPYFKHSITMQNCLVRKDGNVTVVKEPHLMLNAVPTPWSEIRKKIFLDRESRLYSKENGERKRWTYLEKGLTKLNDDHFAHPQALRKLDQAPQSCKIQIVTTHAHKEDWCLADRVLEGTRHSFFRIIPGQDFSVRHPEMHLEQGNVYSFGWGTIWRDFNIFSPLSTLKGRWYSPDDWEFLKQDQCVTTIDVTDEQIIKLMGVIRKRSKEELPFHFITANCCGITAQVLHEAGIVDLVTKEHMARVKYEFLVPKAIRTPLDKIGSFTYGNAPEFVRNAFENVAGFFYSLVFAPLFSLFGAWRTTISYENEDVTFQENIKAKASNRIKALFSNIFDLFRPSKMEFDMTKNIYNWQQQQSGTVYEKHD